MGTGRFPYRAVYAPDRPCGLEMGAGGNGIRRGELRGAGGAMEVAAASVWKSETHARDSRGVRGAVCEFDFSAAPRGIAAELPDFEFRRHHARESIWIGGRGAAGGSGDRDGFTGGGVAAGAAAEPVSKSRGHAGNRNAGSAGDRGDRDLLPGSETFAESGFRARSQEIAGTVDERVAGTSFDGNGGEFLSGSTGVVVFALLPSTRVICDDESVRIEITVPGGDCGAAGDQSGRFAA